MRYEIKQLNVGGILDQAIKLTTNHFKLLFSITLVMMAPFAVIVGLLSSFVTPTIDAANPPAPGAEFSAVSLPIALAIGLLSIVNILVVYPLTVAALTHAIASVYLQKPTSVGNSFSRAFRVLGPLIVTGILVYLIIVVGTILCIIPGIIASFILFLTTQVVVVEGVWGMDALKRSRQLMKGNVGTAVVLIILIFIIQLGLSFGGNLIPQKQIGAVVTALFQSAVFVFTSAAWVVFYFSCRCKAENFDLAILADAVAEE
jgi:hypothetical protein